MQLHDPNVAKLRQVARALDDLCQDVVFLGGAVSGLLITDPGAGPVRATMDVDGVTRATLGRYHDMEQELRSRGFTHDIHSGINCRWIHKASALVFDLMPIDAAILGFSNPWYGLAIETAVWTAIGEDVVIRLVTAPVFLATKFSAFEGRGNHDLLASHDIEDVLNIVDGRDELKDEIETAPAELRAAVLKGFAGMVAHRDWGDLPGMLADPGRAGLVNARIQAILTA